MCCCGQGHCKIIAAMEIVLGGITFTLGIVYEYGNVPAFIGRGDTYKLCRHVIGIFGSPPSLVRNLD